jgi:hypothetical protein
MFRILIGDGIKLSDLSEFILTNIGIRASFHIPNDSLFIKKLPYLIPLYTACAEEE